MYFEDLSKEELSTEYHRLLARYHEYLAMHLSLDRSRGKPSVEQLDNANELLTNVTHDDVIDAAGVDIRNYGEPDGISELRDLISQIINIDSKNIIIGGVASLNLMFETISRAYLKGLANSDTPWSKLQAVKFIAPVPGYDRHFQVSDYFGMQIINIPLEENGPNMDLIEGLVKNDPLIKGMWCVPIYANPEGTVYSHETIVRLASMECAAKDFTIIWDNAYCIHNLYDDYTPEIYNVLDIAEKYGNPDRFITYFSSSKITYAGGGISALAASDKNLELLRETFSRKSICEDKVNQMRHFKYLKDLDNVHKIMKQHASVIRPKFEMVLDIFDRELSEVKTVHWTKPKGGYFISFYCRPGTARRVYHLCKNAGVILTSAGASYPHGIDPYDSNIRVAPSYPTLDELKTSAELFCCCVKLSIAEKLLNISSNL